MNEPLSINNHLLIWQSDSCAFLHDHFLTPTLNRTSRGYRGVPREVDEGRGIRESHRARWVFPANRNRLEEH